MTDEMRVRQAAEALGVHENTIRNWERRGILRACRVLPSGVRRFAREDVERMRREMLTEYAPATELPAETKRPTRRHTLTDGDIA